MAKCFQTPLWCPHSSHRNPTSQACTLSFGIVKARYWVQYQGMVETVERKQKPGTLTREIADVSRVPFILWVFKVLREGRTGRSRLCSYLKWGVECSKIFAELSLFELGSNRNWWLHEFAWAALRKYHKLKTTEMGTCLVVQWLGRSQCRGPRAGNWAHPVPIPGQGTRSSMPQVKDSACLN